MTLNPIKALSEAFEKLITEHGSAIIQEKHIALLREQLSLLEKQFSLLESENTVLKTEKQTLKTKIDDLEKENHKLREKIQGYEQPHDNLLDPMEEKILLFLYNHTKLTLEQIAQKAEISVPLAQMYLKNLFNKGMAITYPAADRKTYWHIKEIGTKYLKDHKLIS